MHQKLSGGRLRELDSASGGSWGGTQVDKHFVAMLAECLGANTMRTFQKECLQDVFDLLKEFETTKRTITPETTGKSNNKALVFYVSIHVFAVLNKVFYMCTLIRKLCHIA